MGRRLERLLSILLTAAALVIAFSIARREFFGGRSSQDLVNSGRQSAAFEPEWESSLEIGVPGGVPSAPVQIVQFADLECPACREFEVRTLSVARDQYGDRLGAAYVHFPLPYHRFARIAAQAAECADTQGRFQPFVTTVYARQDSIGLKPWVSYALDAGIVDTAAFDRCLRADEPSPRIQAGFELGQRLGVRGTPTVIINGWRFNSPPSLTDLTRTIGELLDGRRPSLAADTEP